MYVTSKTASDKGGAAAVAVGSARGRWSPVRILSVLVGVVLALCSFGAFGAGAVAVGGGPIDLGAHGTFRTDGYALTSDPVDWRTRLFGAVGTVHFTAASADGKPAFIGVAKPGEVRHYLRGVEYTTVHENTGNGNTRTEHDGQAPAVRPAGAIDWTAQASGTGPLTLRWDADSGTQQLVAMSRQLHSVNPYFARFADRAEYGLITSA